MTDAHTAALRANTKALNALASAQSRLADELRIKNLLDAAAFNHGKFQTSEAYAKALHKEAIEQIGVKL